MYRFKSFSDSPHVYLEVNNQPVVRAIDAVEGDFVINKFGHIRSDFAVLTETNSSAEMAKALMSMQSAYNDNSSQFDGMTFEQMVGVLRPRWCQLPGEVDRFEQYLIDNALDFYKSLRAKEELKNPEDVPEKPAVIDSSTPAEE